MAVPGMEVDYFEEALSSTEQVQQYKVELNKWQCQYLASKLAETGSFLEAKKETLRAVIARDDIRRKALLMLNFTVKRAEKLVRNCCCEVESWLEAAVTLAQIREDIVDILLDLQWWKSMVEIAIASVTLMSFELELLTCAEEDFETLLRQLTQGPSNDLDRAVVEDREDLMKRLRQVQASPKTRHQYLLAAHVRSRLENTTFETMGDPDLNVYDESNIIGMGGFGAVMNVRWLGRRCALKVLKYKCRKEATSLSRFHHPHIVQFYRYWEAPFGATPAETPYSTPRGGITTPSRSDTSMTSLEELQSNILMELLPSDLAKHMKTLIKVKVGFKRRHDPSPELVMSEDAAIDSMLQIAKAMWHLYSKGVRHRHLTPNNVLVRPVSNDEVPELSARGYLRVKLGDFGLAKTKAYSTVTATQTAMVGTKIYGAPEVFNKEVFSERGFPGLADVWSFGIMFNEILSGRPPVDPSEGRVADLQGKLRKGWRPPLPENCPDYLKFCITSCWQLSPQDRPNFADLWRMVRLAQVRSLGIIRENHALFVFKTRDSRLNSLSIPPPKPGKNGNSQPNPVWLIICRIAYLLGRRRDFSVSKRQSSNTGSSSRLNDKPLGYLVNRVWPEESTSETALDVIFFEGNVGYRKYLSCKDTWVQRGKPDVWWPRDWLPEKFRGDIRVLLLEYSISEAGVEGVVDEVQRLLVFSNLWNRGQTWERPVVLVGHSLGCVVIEQLVVALHKRVKAMASLDDEMEIERAKVSKAFLLSLAGCFFYAPPWKGLVSSEKLLKHVFGGLSYSRALFADLCLDSPKLHEVSKKFVEARSEHLRLMAVIEGFHTKGRTIVPLASMKDFAGQVVQLPDSNHEDACKPINQEHPIYAKLVEFIRDVSNAERVLDKPLSSSVIQMSLSGEYQSRSTVQGSPSFQNVVGSITRDVSNSRRDFDGPLFSLVSQTTPSEGSHSRSTVKESLSFQKVVGSLLKKVVSGPSHFHANQCKILKVQLSLAKEILIKGRASRGDTSCDLPWPKLALTELRRVLKLGRTLIKDCQYNKLCLKAFLRQRERAQAIAEIFSAIAWCKSVVKFYHDNGIQLSSTAMYEFTQVRLGDEEHNMLARAAEEDQMELQVLLDSWVVKHVCSAKECGRPLNENQADNFGICLAAQISAKVPNSGGGVEADHTTILWRTSQDALDDGKELGSGGYGTVTETTWLEDKYAKKEFDMIPTDFENEANALAKLNHPHIVKVLAYGVGPHVCFFLMDIMPSNLRKYMNKRMQLRGVSQPFSLSAAMDLMLQISEAMRYINFKEMVHRDLKPENILVKPLDDAELREEGFVIAKLADFGLAKSKHEITSHSHLTRENLGTTLWRAPEMFRIATPLTDKAYPWQADVYSFGIVCSEILTGKGPFHHVKKIDLSELYSLLTDPENPLRPELPQNCSKGLASLIRECWQANPTDRPTFQEISTRLRFLKAIFMVTGSESSI